MRSDIVPGGVFPIMSFPTIRTPHKLSELQGNHPLILTLACKFS